MGTAPPPIDRFTDRELAAILAAATDLHHYPIVLLMARGPGCGSARPAGCAGETWT